MTTLPGRTNTALLVIDVQVGVMHGTVDRDGVVSRIGSLVERARDADIPVIWVQHTDEELPAGSDVWEYVPELQRRDDEPLVPKQYGDSFEDTNLEELLAERRVGHLVVRVRRDAGGRRPHDSRPHRLRRALPGPGDQAHESLLAIPDRARSRRRGRRRRRPGLSAERGRGLMAAVLEPAV